MAPHLVQPSRGLRRRHQATAELPLDGDGDEQVPEIQMFVNLRESSTQSGEHDTSDIRWYRLRSDIVTFSGDRGHTPAGGETYRAVRRRSAVDSLA